MVEGALHYCKRVQLWGALKFIEGNLKWTSL